MQLVEVERDLNLIRQTRLLGCLTFDFCRRLSCIFLASAPRRSAQVALPPVIARLVIRSVLSVDRMQLVQVKHTRLSFRV